MAHIDFEADRSCIPRVLTWCIWNFCEGMKCLNGSGRENDRVCMENLLLICQI